MAGIDGAVPKVHDEPEAIRVSNVHLNYGSNEVLKGVSLSVHRGEVFGLLGPNGAGKTTMLHLLATLLKPKEGSITFGGRDIKDVAWARKQICLVPQQQAIDVLLSTESNLKFFALLQEVPSRSIRERVLEALSALSLQDHRKKTIFQLSGGLCRRLQFAPVLMSKAPLLLLDEPTIGVDPAARYALWDLIRKQAKQMGKTVILATNDMGEADALCDRVMMLREGRTALIESPQKLKALVKATTVKFELSSFVVGLVPDLSGINGILETDLHEGVLEVTFSNIDSNIGKVIERLEDLGCKVRQLHVKQPTLDEAFIALTRKGA